MASLMKFKLVTRPSSKSRSEEVEPLSVAALVTTEMCELEIERMTQVTEPDEAE
jgi:hypothetical protein